MKRLLGKSLLASIVIFVNIVLAGCAGSRATVVQLDLKSTAAEAVSLMPFNANCDKKYYSDIDEKYNISLLGGLIANEINKRSGIYTYTFDEKDLANLRTSIINSLKASNHFSGVNDIQKPGEKLPNTGTRVYIDFESMGVSKELAFICEINAHVKICDASEKVLVEKDLHISEKGILTLMEGKNKAIKKFVKEIGVMFNSI